MREEQSSGDGGSVLLQPATRGDLAVVLRLLELCQLPTEDVPPIVDSFVTARIADRVVGVIALESYGEVGLLRSLAVDPDFRGRRLGRRLCQHVLQHARRRAIASVFLLTTDAAGYFATLGFHEVDRARAPDAIRATTQFRELCPDSATLMCREPA